MTVGPDVSHALRKLTLVVGRGARDARLRRALEDTSAWFDAQFRAGLAVAGGPAPDPNAGKAIRDIEQAIRLLRGMDLDGLLRPGLDKCRREARRHPDALGAAEAGTGRIGEEFIELFAHVPGIGGPLSVVMGARRVSGSQHWEKEAFKEGAKLGTNALLGVMEAPLLLGLGALGPPGWAVGIFRVVWNHYVISEKLVGHAARLGADRFAEVLGRHGAVERWQAWWDPHHGAELHRFRLWMARGLLSRR
jgi:hypothetical protein